LVQKVFAFAPSPIERQVEPVPPHCICSLAWLALFVQSPVQKPPRTLVSQLKPLHIESSVHIAPAEDILEDELSGRIPLSAAASVMLLLASRPASLPASLLVGCGPPQCTSANAARTAPAARMDVRISIPPTDRNEINRCEVSGMCML
jgi:hypothetical protein